jgi:hypothetical protein
MKQAEQDLPEQTAGPYPTENSSTLRDGRERGWFWAHNSIFDMGLSPWALLVYFALAKHSDGDGASFPKVRTLCDELGIGKTKVKEARAELEKAELLKTKAVFDHGRQVSNTYVIYGPDGAARRLGGRVAATPRPCSDPPGGRTAATNNKTHTNKNHNRRTSDATTTTSPSTEQQGQPPATPGALDLYTGLLEKKFGVAPTLSPKDLAIFAELVQRYGDRLTVCVEQFFQTSDPWVQKSDYGVKALRHVMATLLKKTTPAPPASPESLERRRKEREREEQERARREKDHADWLANCGDCPKCGRNHDLRYPRCPSTNEERARLFANAGRH